MVNNDMDITRHIVNKKSSKKKPKSASKSKGKSSKGCSLKSKSPRTKIAIKLNKNTDLNELTYTELQMIARQQCIPFGGLSKKVLIERIKKYNT